MTTQTGRDGIADPWQQRRVAENKPRRDDHRSPYQRDRARILHSAAFRRLQAKTQMLGIGESDFHRTRLTHSLEVAQIGTGIAAQLKRKYPEHHNLAMSQTLIEALGLAHDIGHPPFGHGGEIALNYMMRDHGGFEGNGQTFRILVRLEPYTQGMGMNLARRTLLGVLKYPQVYSQLVGPAPSRPTDNFRQLRADDWIPPKAVFDADQKVLDWVLAPLSDSDRALFQRPIPGKHHHQRTRFKSFDCSIMELADDIAYSVHDLEDAVVMGIVSEQDWRNDVLAKLFDSEDTWLSNQIADISNKLFSQHHHLRKDAIGCLVNAFITAIEIAKVDGEFSEPLLQYNARLTRPYADALAVLKRFVFKRVISKPEYQLIEYKGQQMVMELFEAFASDPQRLLPENSRQRWQEADDKGEEVQMRIIADYISGMTDEFAAKLYHQMFTPKGGMSF